MPNLHTYYRDHWLNVDDERLETYEKMFAWSPEMEPLIAPAGFGPGQLVVDFGCGPGHMCIELARRVGPEGHVHGVDINETFVRQTRQRAGNEGLSDRISASRLVGDKLPFEDASIDRVLCKNVLEYVDDPLATLSECRRVLRPGGRPHAADSDWGFFVAEPLAPERAAALISAAAHAFKTPLIGRRLYGLCRSAGYADIALDIAPVIDTEGRYKGLLENMAGYAREAGTLPEAEIADMTAVVDRAIVDGTYLFVLPKFLVTATA